MPLVTRLTSSASAADNAMVAIYAKVWRQAARHADDQSILAWITTIAGEETRTIQTGTSIVQQGADTWWGLRLPQRTAS